MNRHVFQSFNEANHFAKSIAKNSRKLKLSRDDGSFIVEYESPDEIQKSPDLDCVNSPRAGNSFLDNEPQKNGPHNSASRNRIEAIKIKHKKFVESVYETYKGVTECPERTDTRERPCEFCKSSTSSETVLVCNGCKGKVCLECGACNCDCPF
jgi:hypothetical protein